MSIGQYEILRELGRGQFGAVYLAVGQTPGRGGAPGKRRVVAIKTLREATNAESLRLLRQEFALLDQVKHRAIVRVFEFLEAENAVVMEYVHGVTLRSVMDDCAKAREQVYTEAAIEIGCEVADALYQAFTSPADNGEALALVHRDLKPENVMLTASGEVKVLDFGLARVDNAEWARDDASRVRGTPLYMSPEQARGELIDHRSDLFALGLLLYELLLGHPAYRIPTDVPNPVAAAFAAIEAGALDAQCRELESKLPGMGPVVARLLQANPRNRYPNGQDLLVDLRRQLYRERGSFVKEFCSFYFGSLHPLPPTPDPDSPKGAPMSTDKRKSIEEKLAESMAGEADPSLPRAPVPVRRAPMAAPPSAVPPAPPPTAAPPAPSPVRSSAPKIVPRTASAARNAPLPPDDALPPGVRGGARPASSPGGPPKPGNKKMVGARSPDETGMLQMVPLASEDEQEAAGDPSATAFFAIPAPKAERAKTPTPSAPASGAFAPPSGPTPMAPPPMASMVGQSPGGFVPPAPSGIGMGAPAGIGMGAPAGPASGIAGPSSGGGGHGGTPFNVSGQVPTQGSSVESRMQSTRVFAIIAAAMFMLCMAILAAAGIVFYQLNKDEPTPAVVATAPTTTTTPPPQRRDTGQVAPKPKTTSTKTTSAPKTTPSAPAAPKVGATAPVTVNFGGATIPTTVEVACDGGFRERASVRGGTATVANVPTSGSCKMYPKGGVVGSSQAVRGGAVYNCTISGTTTSCK